MAPKQNKRKAEPVETTIQKLRRAANETKASRHAWHCENIALAVQANPIKAQNVWF